MKILTRFLPEPRLIDRPGQSASPIERLRDFYFRIDRRSLALFRILLGLLLLYDWYDRWIDLEAFYTSSGVLPHDAPLPRGGGDFHFTLLDTVTYLPLVQLFFIAALIGYLCLVVGYRTKVAQIVAFVFFLSVTNRNVLIGHGGDVVILTMLAWSIFLPLGSRFSVDSVVQAMKSGVDLRSRAREVADRGRVTQAGDPTPPSVAAFAIVCQIVAIYVMSAYSKCGAEWSDGTAVWYTLQLDQFSTPIGRWVADGPMSVLTVLTRATVLIEYSALLFLIPFGQPIPRRVAIGLLAGLHLGTVFTMVLGTFPLIMICTYALVLLPADWALISRAALRWSRPVTVYYDDTCGFCYRYMQLLAIADRANYIRFIGNTDRQAFQHKLSHPEVDRSIVVFDDASRQKTVGASAISAIFGALPLPFHIFRFIRAPGVRVMSDAVYAWVAVNRYRFSAWLGYRDCGLDRVPQDGAVAAQQTPPIRLVGTRLGSGVVNAVAAAFLVSLLVNGYNNTMADCAGTPTISEPPWMYAAIHTTQVIQSWAMLAPPAKDDGWWVVDGVTLSGKRVDPLTNLTPTFDKPPDLARSLGVSWRKYLIRLSYRRNEDFRRYFAKYITLKHHREHPEDPLDHFNFYYVEEYTLSPGTPEPWPTEVFLLWEHDCFAGDPNPPRNRPPLIPIVRS